MANSRQFDLSQYTTVQVTNREKFLSNFAKDLSTFEFLFNELQGVWNRVSQERDTQGRSHLGLLIFVELLYRHVVLGFHHLASYQSFLAWSTFRPGLEALLNPREICG